MAKLSVLALSVAVSVSFGDASSFLSKEKQEVSINDVQETLKSLLASSSSLELERIERDLRPMFVALPKNKQGSLDHTTARYALHRYFVHKHGWYMNGLDPEGDGRKSVAAPTLIKDRAPSFIQGLLENRLHGEGLGLHEMAVFAATLSGLVQQEVAASLHVIFDGLKIPAEGSIARGRADTAEKNYVLKEMLDMQEEGMDPNFDLTTLDVHEWYPAWDDLEMWLGDFRQQRDLLTIRNPFVEQHYSFEASAAFVQDMSHNFGGFQKLECMSLKSRLVDMDRQGSGRVLLRDFYAGYKNDPLHHFAESVDYLRNLGALDDRDPTRMSVVIPNYIISKTNCLSASGFYSICCFNECEGLTRNLEIVIAAPSGTPVRIAEVISSLPSDTVDAPRNLSSALLGRLDEIAKLHGGEVPVYGRLFSQWMHHAYPRECPFPQVSGTTSPLAPEQWMAQGQSDVASMEEVDKYLNIVPDAESVAEELPWTAVEELVVDYAKPSSTSGLCPVLRCVAFVVAIASFAAPMVHAMKAGQSSDKTEKCMV